MNLIPILPIPNQRHEEAARNHYDEEVSIYRS